MSIKSGKKGASHSIQLAPAYATCSNGGGAMLGASLAKGGIESWMMLSKCNNCGRRQEISLPTESSHHPGQSFDNTKGMVGCSIARLARNVKIFPACGFLFFWGVTFPVASIHWLLVMISVITYCYVCLKDEGKCGGNVKGVQGSFVTRNPVKDNAFSNSGRFWYLHIC